MGGELGEVKQEAVQSLSPLGKDRGSGVYTYSNLPFGREEGEVKRETEGKEGRRERRREGGRKRGKEEGRYSWNCSCAQPTALVSWEDSQHPGT